MSTRLAIQIKSIPEHSRVSYTLVQYNILINFTKPSQEEILKCYITSVLLYCSGKKKFAVTEIRWMLRISWIEQEVLGKI